MTGSAILSRALLAAALLAAAPPACADEKIVAATCAEGRGCTCRLTEVTAREAALVLGIDTPAGATLLETGTAPLALSPESPDALHRRHGGTGPCEIALFDPPRPRDGRWSLAPGPLSVRGNCLPQVRAGVEPMLAAMAETREIRWQGVFHPDRFRLAQGGPALAWHRLGPTEFVSEAGTTTSPMIRVRYRARLLSEDRATVRAEIALRGGPAALGMRDCSFTSVLDARLLD